MASFGPSKLIFGPSYRPNRIVASVKFSLFSVIRPLTHLQDLIFLYGNMACRYANNEHMVVMWMMAGLEELKKA